MISMCTLLQLWITQCDHYKYYKYPERERERERLGIGFITMHSKKQVIACSLIGYSTLGM